MQAKISRIKFLKVETEEMLCLNTINLETLVHYITNTIKKNPISANLDMMSEPWGGGGYSFIWAIYSYVRPQRVGVFNCFGHF